MVSKLQILTEKDVLRIKEVFAKYRHTCFVKQRHTRFMKSFSYHLPFGTKEAYTKEIMAADLGNLANLIRICGFLMQTRIYSIWTRKQGKKKDVARNMSTMIQDQIPVTMP